MNLTSNSTMWLLWIIFSLTLAGFFAFKLFAAEDKSVFMPGPLTDGHHQLVDKCETCHTDAFGGGEVLQEACLECHGDLREKPNDSHPRSKFKDPRNADRLEKINAVECITCHTEHKPEITLKDGLTQPLDVCFHCHSDIAEDRPSHAGMDFMTCKDSGCHNYHNNRALYTDFLIKHMAKPALLEKRKLPAKEFAEILDQIIEYPREAYPITPLTVDDIDAPTTSSFSAGENHQWLETSHAKAGVNCSACHQPLDENQEKTAWIDKPGPEGCVNCHTHESKTFQQGKHGMRIAAGLGPMTPEQARLPMKDTAAHEELTCVSCHGAHDFDVQYAAVEGCLQCHDDEHSRAYEGSPHHKLWLDETAGNAEPNTGVSCASCHMPRVDFDMNDWMSRKLVNHNQSLNLSPNSKMIRESCLHCHGLGFAIDSLADQTLINNNFRGQPSAHVKSMELAKEYDER